MRKKIVSLICLTMLVSCILFDVSISEVYASPSRLIINSYEVEDDVIEVGSDFTLNMEIQNMNDEEPVGNIVISGNTENGEIVPAYGVSNQVFVKVLKANEKKTISFQFHVQKQMINVSIPVLMTIQYSDASGQEHQNYATISIPVVEEGMLSVTGLTVADNTTFGTPARVNANLENLGNEGLRDVVMHIEGDITDQEKIVHIGEIAPGGKNFTESYIDLKAEGEQKISVHFTYSDAEEMIYETPVKSYTIRVDKKSQTVNSLDDPENESYVNGMFSFSIGQVLILIAIVVLICGAVVYAYQKKRKG